MPATSALRSKILVQMAIIIALGFGIGIAQAIIKPVKLDRDAPPELPPIPVSPQAGNTKPAQASPAPGDPPAPAPTPVTATTPPQPATPDPAAPFKFSTKDDLKDKKGHITIEEAKGLFDAAATFLDSRKPEPFAAGHVKDAYRLELSDFRDGDPAILGLIPRDAYVVVYCSGGHCDESEAVAQMMDASGYKKVYVMHDGFPGWKAAGHPVATGE